MTGHYNIHFETYNKIMGNSCLFAQKAYFFSKRNINLVWTILYRHVIEQMSSLFHLFKKNASML